METPEESALGTLCATLARGTGTYPASRHWRRLEGTALFQVCPAVRQGQRLWYDNETLPQVDHAQEARDALTAPPHEGQAQEHRLSLGRLQGHPRIRVQHSGRQLPLGLRPEGHAGAHGEGVAIGRTSI